MHYRNYWSRTISTENKPLLERQRTIEKPEKKHPEDEDNDGTIQSKFQRIFQRPEM